MNHLEKLQSMDKRAVAEFLITSTIEGKNYPDLELDDNSIAFVENWLDEEFVEEVNG